MNFSYKLVELSTDEVAARLADAAKDYRPVNCQLFTRAPAGTLLLGKPDVEEVLADGVATGEWRVSWPFLYCSPSPLLNLPS